MKPTIKCLTFGGILVLVGLFFLFMNNSEIQRVGIALIVIGAIIGIGFGLLSNIIGEK